MNTTCAMGLRAAIPAAVLPLLAAACEPPPEPFDPVGADIAGIRAAVVDGRIRCGEVVQAHLARIEAYDQASGLH
ncbi:MAG: hypothetical protein ACOCUZ_01500, partial [bacterium]